jgi:uncharacterized repeat protein (TIGR01451 family)
MNAIAVRIDGTQLAALRRLPGVKGIQPLALEYPASNSVPFIGAPQVWNDSLGLGQSLTGSGVTIGIIDTGIDYQHANFGGTGQLADYQANNRTIAPDAFFPTAKVVGGTDFAGDAYNGNNTPVPDPDPMDCNGHGTHVAGTAAGFGVQANGSTYPGPYGPSTPFGALRIGPGVAPAAKLYALRVFGCGGGTDLTVQAIEWAMDPNGDSDFSDHLDVINMSLGSDFGGPSDTTSIAAENAARAGVIVVASAGNSGDTYFITGSPGTSGRTISVAAVADDGVPGALLQVNAPAAIAGGYTAAAADFGGGAPAPSGQTASIVQALDPADAGGPLTTDGCTALTNAAAIAGNIALIDRGTCGFQVKVANAQAAGAIGAIVVNNVAGDPNPFAMGPTAGQPAITIPAIMIALADGNTIKAQLGGGVNATLVAATAADTLASFSSRGPRLGSPTVLKPDIAAPGVDIISAQTGVTCTSGGCITASGSGYLADNQALTLSGTSMASPHIAGTMALLRQLHPDWTVEELKALAMNGALHDITLGANGSGFKYSPSRTGAGRVDVAGAAQNQAVAFNADDAGLVSVAFDPEVMGSSTQVRHIRLVNHGLAAVTYDLAINTILSAPGVSFSLPGGNTITVPAGQAATLDVQMDANAAQMDHTKDPTVASTQAAPSPLNSLGNLSRHWLTEASGYVTFSMGGQPKLRMPVYIAPRPASTMQGAGTIATGGAPTGSTTIPLSGSDVCTGTLGAGPACTGTFPTDEVSLVTPFELQAVHARDTTLPDYANVQYGGVAYDTATNLLMFGVSTWGDWSSPTDVAFNIYIDNNSDGTYDRILFNSNPGTMASSLFGQTGVGQDSFISSIFNIATSGVSIGTFVNRQSAAAIDSALLRNNVMFLTATPAQLGLPGGTTNFRYRIETCPGIQPLCGPLTSSHLDSVSGPFSWNYAAASQGLNFGGANLAQDLNGASLPITWNQANLTANGSLGALLLHHHNAQGTRAQPILVEGSQSADVAITQSAAPATPDLGQNVTLTLTVSNNGPNAASGVVVSDLLPAGLTYVSDDGGGAYNAASGDWTVGGLAVSASATLHIVATVATTDKIVNIAQLSAATPLDPNPANNQASVTLTPPRQSDLRVSMAASPATTVVGGSATYTMTVTNLGDDPAYNLAPSQTFPAGGVSIDSYIASQGIFNSSTGIWNIASLGKGFSATLTLTVTTITSGPLTNTGLVTLAGDPNAANNSASATVTVNKRATAASVALAPPAIVFGQSSVATVIVTDTEAIGPTSNPAGTVTLSDAINGTTFTPSATCTLAPVGATTNRSSCQVTVVPGVSGSHTISASYGGSTVHMPANRSGAVNVSKANTTTTITGHTPAPSLVGQVVTISFAVAAVVPGAGTPTGSVTVTDGTLSCTATVAVGQCPLTFTSTGSYTLTANYVGDTNFNGSSAAAVTHQVMTNQYRLYLPLIGRGGTPDLIVSRLELSSAKTTFMAGEPVELKVTVTNTGDAAASPFWVDLYMNPSSPPTAANEPWNTRCGMMPCFGMAWRVVDGLAPGASITLTSKDLSTGYSSWPGWFAAGTTDLYVYADSYNPGVAFGAVAEGDETNNRLHVGGLTVSGSNPPITQLRAVADLRARR